jgi:glycosyltransferase involved in cell wall biosynthesis
MQKILLISDSGVPTGYGRIADNVAIRLTQRGFHVVAASFAYDGLLPAMMNGHPLPYHVATLQLKRAMGNWGEDVMKLVGAVQPDVIMVIQDAPYAEQVRHLPIDWSQHKFVVVTPVDGVPIAPQWVELLKQSDAALSISEFGVNAYRQAGVPITLCRPGVNLNTFYPLHPLQKAELRAKLGVPQDAFILGTMAQNQGRKAVPKMLEAFFKFATDKPNALYLLDMDKVSAMGWNIPDVCKQRGWDVKRLIFREDCERHGITELRERYNLLDAHAVISHREGYGIPLQEAMACGVVSMALDYCSGSEIVGQSRGLLIQPIDYDNPSTWGGANDLFPDVDDMVGKLNLIYERPHYREYLAHNGMVWARQQTWDNATDAVYQALCGLYAPKVEPIMMPPPPPTIGPDQPPAPIPEPKEPTPDKPKATIIHSNGVIETPQGAD